MAIEFHCPHCDKLLTTADERASAQAKCPACGELITVPASSAAAAGAPHAAFAPTAAWSPGAAVAYGSAAPFPQADPVQQPRPLAPPQNCPRCGGVVEPGSAFCRSCGLSLVEALRQFPYAGFIRRAAALVIDLTLIYLVAAVLEVFAPRRTWIAGNIDGILWFVYYTFFESSWRQATLGKQIMGVFVATSEGRRMSVPRAAIRTLAKILSLLILVGYLMPLVTARRQALHDILADSIVLRK